MRKSKSLCATCFNYIGCSWHENFTPRDDWEAYPTVIPDYTGDYESFCVTKCPDYKTRNKSFKDFEHVTVAEIAEALKIDIRTAFRYARRDELNNLARRQGYEVKTVKKGAYKSYYMRKYKNENLTKNV